MTKKRQAKEAPAEIEIESPDNMEAEDAHAASVSAEVPPVTPEPGDETLQHRLLRLQADFDNFRKRTQRERTEIYQRANEDLLTELLPIIDHLELGIVTAMQHGAESAVTDGFQLVHDQCLAALKRFGLSPLEAEGKPFDPHLHEAATHLPSEEHPADTVMAQTRRGYMLGGRLLRAAQVVVSSGPAEEAPATEAEEDA